MARRKTQKLPRIATPVGRLVQWGIALALWGVLLVCLILLWYAREIPAITQQATFERRPSVTVLANDGSVITRYGDMKGETLSVDDLPPHLVQAILAVEDRRFYYHFGIDPIGLTRAIVTNFFKGHVAQGGSTITQQLAKNLFLSHERTYKRKIQEAILAFWLEWHLTKDDILSAYLNRVYLGGGAYGVEAASRVYFDKSAKQLTIEEAATLAGMLKAPSRYSPKANPKESRARTQVVLSAMHDAGYLRKDTKLSKTSFRPDQEITAASISNRYFADWARETVSGLIPTPTDDIVIETTLDPYIQAKAGEVINRYVTENADKAKFSQGAAVILRADGSIVAMVGGSDYRESEFNRATKAMRPPGSSFKPVVYLAALENGLGMDTMVMDAPVTINGYHPRNFGGQYYGEVSLIKALTLSLNTVSVQLGYQVGMGRVIGAARRLGIDTPLQPDLALTLGAQGIPMLEMAGAYTVMANGGYATEPYGIRRIRNKSGKTLWQRQKTDAPAVFAGEPIFEIQQMMKSVTKYGTGQAAQGPYDVAGKTGTSQDYRDIWFSGFTSQYVGSVWFGNDNNTPMRGGTTGGSYSARAWRDIMTLAQSDPSPPPSNGYRTFANGVGFSGLLQQLLSSPPDIDPAIGAAAEGPVVLQHPNAQPQGVEEQPAGIGTQARQRLYQLLEHIQPAPSPPDSSESRRLNE
ncbi:MAG: PBP1A family penicillin-binding protein [Pseudomonadota bacterium]